MIRELPIELARHLARLLQSTRRRYRKRLERCQKNCSEKAVHELRVETRRTLALLDLVIALDLAGSPKKPRRTLKKRLDAFDELRDTQVELRLIKPWLKQYPEAQEFAEFLSCREQELVAELRCEIRELESRRVERMLKTLEKDVCAAQGKTSRPVEAALLGPLNETFDQVMLLRRKVRRNDTRTIHCTRIAFKKFRYLCELLQPLLSGMTSSRLKRMHDWQTRTGDIQDAEVLLGQIERAVKRGDVKVDSVKRLHAALAQWLAFLINRFMTTADQLEQFRPKPVSVSESEAE